MIDAAELLKIHVALLTAPDQFERDTATTGPDAAADKNTETGPTQPAPRRTMTLAGGKYYVTEAKK